MCFLGLLLLKLGLGFRVGCFFFNVLFKVSLF